MYKSKSAGAPSDSQAREKQVNPIFRCEDCDETFSVLRVVIVCIVYGDTDSSCPGYSITNSLIRKPRLVKTRVQIIKKILGITMKQSFVKQQTKVYIYSRKSNKYVLLE